MLQSERLEFQDAQLFILPHVSNKAKAAAHLSTFGFCRNTGHKMKNQKSLNIGSHARKIL